MYYLLQMTIIELANLNLLIEKLQADNELVPAKIIDDLVFLNKFLAMHDSKKLKDVDIHRVRLQMKRIYRAFFGFFSSEIIGKKDELEQRGVGCLARAGDIEAIAAIYSLFKEEADTAEENLAHLSHLGAGNEAMLDDYHQTISNILNKLYAVMDAKKDLCQSSDNWSVSEINHYLNQVDADFLDKILKVFHQLDIDKYTLADFQESYDDVVQSTGVRKKQSEFASLYECMMRDLIDTFGDFLRKKRKDISSLLSDLHYAQDRFKELDKAAMLNFSREDFSTTIWSEIKTMSSFLKPALHGLNFLLSPDFVLGLTVAQKQVHEKLILLTTLDQASVMPILHQYRSYQKDVLNLFSNGILKDVFLSDADYHLMAKKTAGFLELLSPLPRLSFGIFVNDRVVSLSTAKNADCSDPVVRVKSPALNQGMSNHFFLGWINHADNAKKDPLLPSINTSSI